MKIRFKVLNGRTTLRALVVAVGAAVIGGFAGSLARGALDTAYRLSDSEAIYALFYLLSRYSSVIMLVCFVLVMAAFANWILYPSFEDFSNTVVASLRLGEEKAQEIGLPRPFRVLEQQLKDTTKEIQLWQYEMREAEKRKDDLVMYLAHDLRTPLSSVLGYLELLEEADGLPEEARWRYQAIALRKARRMQLLVEDLFEVTRYNIHHIELRRERVQLGIMLRQLVEEMQPALKRRSLRLEMELCEGCTAMVDPAKLSRAVDNLLYNAASYAPEGGTITLRLTSGTSETCIEVENEGLEISGGELERVFERFYRGDGARGTNSGGSGLGLAIARGIVRAHEGDITAASSGGLTTFRVLLPKT